MSSPSDVFVPSVGPLDAKIMLIGEAPGSDEEVEGEPFVGKSGQFLERYLNRVGIPRKEVRLTNLCHYRPKGNKFETLLGTRHLIEGLASLDAEIKSMPNLNLIVTLGNWPMYYLTGCTSTQKKPGSGIMLWRGSLVPGVGTHVPSALGRKILMTYHPAFIIRPQGFGFHPIFFNDLRRIPLEQSSPDLNYPLYEEYIDPPNALDIANDMSTSEWLTVDIETFGEPLACVGFTDSIKRALCITTNNPTGWGVARELLANKQRKILQFGVFDVNWLWWHYHWDVGGYLDGQGFDTYIAAANLMPEFKRGLDFLTSMYTPFPFYKEERKIWKETGDLESYWHYNVKDVISQTWIAHEQMKELRELYGS